MPKLPSGDVTFTKVLLACALAGMLIIVIYDSIVTPGRSIPDIVVSTFGGIIGWLINSQGSQQNAKQAAETLQKAADIAPTLANGQPPVTP